MREGLQSRKPKVFSHWPVSLARRLSLSDVRPTRYLPRRPLGQAWTFCGQLLGRAGVPRQVNPPFPWRKTGLFLPVDVAQWMSNARVWSLVRQPVRGVPPGAARWAVWLPECPILALSLPRRCPVRLRLPLPALCLTEGPCLGHSLGQIGGLLTTGGKICCKGALRNNKIR